MSIIISAEWIIFELKYVMLYLPIYSRCFNWRDLFISQVDFFHSVFLLAISLPTCQCFPYNFEKYWYSLIAHTISMSYRQKVVSADSASSVFFLFGVLSTYKLCNEWWPVNSKYNSSELQQSWFFVMFQGSPQFSFIWLMYWVFSNHKIHFCCIAYSRHPSLT